MRVGEVGNGTPQGGELKLNIEGGFNHIEDSSFVLTFDLEDRNSYPDLDSMILIQPFNIGEDLYE
ncbi:MAG: hypothetical protein Q4A90_10155 [Streptococcus sp.]|nr:hypothetical protein [Streptococcus sp.]